jgi:hypothetical protein
MDREKKSDSIEVRIPYGVKRAFAAQCRERGSSVSEAIRGFVEAELRQASPDAPRRRFRLTRPVAVFGSVATLAAALVIGPASVSAAPDFGPGFTALDRNHDGAISPGEFGDDSRRKSDMAGCGRLVLVVPLARESMPQIRGVRPFAVPAADFTFAAIDRDHDGRISSAEYAGHWIGEIRKGFDHLDGNHDGTISRHEYAEAFRPAFMGDPPDIAPFLELDRNRDGKIEWDEFVA